MKIVYYVFYRSYTEVIGSTGKVSNLRHLWLKNSTQKLSTYFSGRSYLLCDGVDKKLGDRTSHRFANLFDCFQIREYSLFVAFNNIYQHWLKINVKLEKWQKGHPFFTYQMSFPTPQNKNTHVNSIKLHGIYKYIKCLIIAWN